MNRLVKLSIVVFSLFFLTITVFEEQKSFSSLLKKMSVFQEETACSCSFESQKYVNQNNLTDSSNDEEKDKFLPSADITLFYKINRIFLLFIAIICITINVSAKNSERNKFEKVRVTRSTYF